MKSPLFIKTFHPDPNWKKKHPKKRTAKKIQFTNNYKSQHDQLKTFKTPNARKGFAYKFFGILLISLSALICSYQTYDRFSFYLSRPTDTKVSLIRNSSVKFPSITLCAHIRSYIPLVGLKKEKAKQRKMKNYCDVHVTALLDDTHNISTLWDLMTINKTLESASEFSRSLVIRSSSRRDVIKPPPSFSIKTDTKTMLGTCNTYSFKNTVRFQKDDFMLMFTFYKNLELCSAGIFTFTFHNDDDIVTYKAASGSKEQKPLAKAAYGVSAKRFKILNEPGKPCDTNQKVNECEKNCFEKNLNKTIRCRLPLTSLPEVPLCANEKDAFDAYNQLLDLTVSFNYLKECNCPKICDEMLYTDHFKMTEKSDNSILFIYFDDNVIEEIEEYYSYSFISFICDFGGNLGLFLGLSIPARLCDFSYCGDPNGSTPIQSGSRNNKGNTFATIASPVRFRTIKDRISRLNGPPFIGGAQVLLRTNRIVVLKLLPEVRGPLPSGAIAIGALFSDPNPKSPRQPSQGSKAIKLAATCANYNPAPNLSDLVESQTGTQQNQS
uniref:Uncharacterized protein n=1 Tax=Strigamia maritima TaxID=126957 RepID=T1ITG8_STRMM